MYNGMKFLKLVLQMAVFGSSSNSKSLRLGSIEGHNCKKNEILFHSSKLENPQGCVIFFGGDCQDYAENMLKHRDNKHYVKWNLEDTCSLLHNHFPNYSIVIIKPAKMGLMTFSCFENFANVNNFGAPTYSTSIEPLKHLQSLLSNLGLQLESLNRTSSPSSLNMNIPLKLVGFSKGCIVLNQFLYSFLTLNKNPEADLVEFTNRISDFYWLDSGHSGSSETWVTNREVLENFATMGKNVHIHVTPYQVMCDTRPRIGKEEKVFRDTLIRLGCNVKRKLHFENEPRSLENHFRVLNVFTDSLC